MGEGGGHGLTISTSFPATGSNGNGSAIGSASSTAAATAAAAAAASGAVVTSPRNDFFVSQRTAADYDLSRVDSLSLEEQEIMASIQELQAQLMQLRAEEDEDSDEDASRASGAHGGAHARNGLGMGLGGLGSGAGQLPGAPSSQLIVVSNNLPVLLERAPQSGRWKATKTTGGLDKLMCLTGVRQDLTFLWVGWVGQHIPKHEHESVRRLLLQHNCLPVFLSSDAAARHNGFSSDVLWALFHYVSEPVAASSSGGGARRFNKQDWRAYESANESFADAIAEIYNEGDAVWIHDYHLMLLPSLLRQRIPLCHIGWFLHTPFPASDVYCRLPVRAELLRGVLQADLVGFQTFDYERHFVSICQRLLGVECSHKGIRSPFGGDRDHITSIGVFPIGISVEPFARAASSVPTLHRVNDLHRKFGTKRIILGVDRLDNIKGIPHKLLAMELLLNRFPEWQHNVVLIQIGISSRSGVVDSSSSSGGGNSASAGAPASQSQNQNQSQHQNQTQSQHASQVSGTAIDAAPTSSTSGGPGGALDSPSGLTPTAATTKPSASTSDATSATASVPATAPPPTSTSMGGAAGGGGGGAGSGIGYDTSQQLEMSSQSYRSLVAQVNQLVGRINGTFGTLDYAPIHFIHQRAMQHEELCALYDLADVCLVTSTRDGMNLVSHEFVVCQQHFMRRKEERKKAARAAARAAYSRGGAGAASVSAAAVPILASLSSSTDPLSPRPPPLAVVVAATSPKRGGATAAAMIPSPQISPTKILTEWEGEEGGPGVLILSEFAGCSQSLSGAIVTNPWNTEDVALSIHQALGMCRAEREIRQQKLYRYVSSNTATAWSMQFLSELGDAVLKNKEGSTQLPKLDLKHIVAAYRKAANRVIILDYDRTLTPQHALLPLAAVGPNFKSLLDTLSADEANTVFIVSARERKFLETWLQGVRVGVAAEDGFFYRMNLSNDREQWKTMSKFQYEAAALRGAASTSTSTVVSGSTDSVSGYENAPYSHNSRRSMSLGSIPSYGASTGSSATSPYGGGVGNAGNYYARGGGGAAAAAAAAAASSSSSRLFATGSSASGSLFADDAFFDGGGQDSSWKDLVLPTMVNFMERTPGSYIEDKESSLTWHYGDADPHFGGWQAKDLQIVLERQLIGTALDVYQGHMYVSVEHEGCTKAKVLEGVLKHLSLPQQIRKKGYHEVDFVLCVCDDTTDDQMFQTLTTLLTESNERHEKKKKDALARAAMPAKRASAPSIRTTRSQRLSVSGAGAAATAAAAAGAAGGSTSSQPAMLARAKSGGIGGSRATAAASSTRTHRTKSASSAASPGGSHSHGHSRRKSDKPSRRRKGRSGQQSELGRLVEGPTEDDDLELARMVDEDNKVAFSRLQKVPVCMAENVSIFTVVVGPDVQHSAGRHSCAYAVDSLGDVRKVLKEFADVSRQHKASTASATTSASTATTSTPAIATATTTTADTLNGPSPGDATTAAVADSTADTRAGYEASTES